MTEEGITFDEVYVAEKGWGREVIFARQSSYTGKTLDFDRAGQRMSLHFHKLKHETWLVLAGSFDLDMLDLITCQMSTKTIAQGDVVVIPPMCPHRLTARENKSRILEVSTRDDIKDSYRIEPGDSQKQKT